MVLIAKMKRWRGVLLAFLAVMALSPAADACVGKTLVIGSKGTLQQDVLAETLSILIGERTGTSIKVVRFDTTAAAHEALMKAELDMYVEYTGVGQIEVLKKEGIGDPEALYQAVKDAYNQNLNLVWLKPLGFEEPTAVSGDLAAQAATVVRKDTLKKFPALARLINKLGGAISAEAIQEMEARAAQASPREAARAFLKQGRFI